jgi:hypothetical protein
MQDEQAHIETNNGKKNNSENSRSTVVFFQDKNLMQLMMASYAETCCLYSVLNGFKFSIKLSLHQRHFIRTFNTELQNTEMLF